MANSKIRKSNLHTEVTTMISTMIGENALDSADFNSILASKTTDDIAEGSNLYYTTTRGDSDFDIRLATKTTDNLSEGSNQYFTNARADARADVRIAAASITDLSDADQAVGTTDDVTFNNLVLTGTIDGPSTMYIDPAPVDSDGGLLVIRGNLQVDGTTTTINSTTVSINDKNIVLADSAANATEADGAGITVNGASATITYDASNDEWDFNKDINVTGTLTTSSSITSGNDVYVADSRHLRWPAQASNSTAKILFGNTAGTGGTLDFRRNADGAQLLTILGSGNVGIGTNSPARPLHVKGTGNSIATFETTLTSDMAIELKNSQGSMFFGLGGGEEFAVGTDADLNGPNSKFVIKNTGNVGIGDTSPSYKLTIGGGHIVLKQDTAATDGTGDIQRQAIGWHTAGAETVLGAYITSSAQGSWGGDLRFNTRGSGGGSSALRMIVEDGGNVGIGIADPGYRFEVSHSSTNVAKFTGATNAYVDFTDGTVNTRLQNSGHAYFGTTGSHDLNLRTGGTDKLTIKSSGNVGIGPEGVLDPSAPLHVGNKSQDLQAMFGYNDSVLDDPYIRIQGRNTANSSGKHVDVGLDADLEIGYLSFSGGTPVVFNNSGHVGIGLTTNIDRKLHVQNDNDYAAKFGGTGSGDYAIEIGQIGTGGSAGFNATGVNGAMKFLISGSEKMRIAAPSGYVGIGTTNPGALLQIGNYDTSGDKLWLTASQNGYSYLRFLDLNSTEGTYISSKGESYGGKINFGARWNTDQDGVTFEMYRSGYGATFDGARVGINNTTPSYTLDVNGKARATAFIGTVIKEWNITGSYSTGTSYVFSDRGYINSLGWGDGMYRFVVYSDTYNAGTSHYQTFVAYDPFYFVQQSSNAPNAFTFGWNAAMGHAPNTGTRAVDLVLRHRYGSDSTYPANQTFEFIPVNGFSNLNGSSGGYILKIRLFKIP